MQKEAEEGARYALAMRGRRASVLHLVCVDAPIR
tara:strand:- start:2651 stop:2752 length:102 start_codon:yes stop_codon:yes gene_type:complete